MPRLSHCLISSAFLAACNQTTGAWEPEAGTPSTVSAHTPITTTTKTPIEGTVLFCSDCLGEVLEVHLREQIVTHTTEVPGRPFTPTLRTTTRGPPQSATGSG
jgi:hypothetical protein